MESIKSVNVGDEIKVICVGLDMRCNQVVSKGVLSRDEDGTVLYSEGIYIVVRESDLGGFYLDTPENRKTLKQLIKNTI